MYRDKKRNESGTSAKTSFDKVICPLNKGFIFNNQVKKTNATILYLDNRLPDEQGRIGTTR